MDKQTEALLNEANTLVQTGQNTEAKNILQKLEKEQKWTPELCGNIVAVYTYGNMQKEALAVHTEYQKRFGKPLDYTVTDGCTEKEIRLVLREQQRSSGKNEFVRMKLFKRGKTSLRWWQAPSKIVIREHELLITRYGKLYRIPYSNITNAYIQPRRMFWMNSTYYDDIVRICYIKTQQGTFVFDVSRSSAHFENSDRLVKLLIEKIDVKVMPLKKQSTLSFIGVRIVFIIVIYLIFQYL